MSNVDDNGLLKAYTKGDEAAFNALVSRYINLVYSTALRQTPNPSQAEEITQTVFIILAQKANSIGPKVILSGWLYQTARLTAANFLRAEMRRQKHEQEAYMESLLDQSVSEVWRQIAPCLDEAMGRLSENDRNVILLRYFENKSAAEIGGMLGIDAPAAQKRLTRAVERLRKFLTHKGVTQPAEMISGAIATCAVQAAPNWLAKATLAMALAKGATASSSTLTLLKGTLKIMAWTKMKTAVIVIAATLFATGTTVVLVEKAVSPGMDESVWEMELSDDGEKDWNKIPPILVIRPAQYSKNATAAMKNYYFSIATLTHDGKTFIKLRDRNVNIVTLLSQAYSIGGGYSIREDRMILPASICKTNRFDLLLTLPGQPYDALQKAIKQKFGLATRLEIRETDVLLLKVKDPGLLSTHVSKPSNIRDYKRGKGSLALYNHPMDAIADYLEGRLKKPVIAQAEFSKHYDLAFHWEAGGNEVQSYFEGLAQAGLELVPSRESIEMLVIEKTE